MKNAIGSAECPCDKCKALAAKRTASEALKQKSLAVKVSTLKNK